MLVTHGSGESVLRALLIGIDRYREAPLSGCANDVDAVAVALERAFGACSRQITALLDEHATTLAIQAAMHALIASAQPGDQVLFHFSGHGATLPSEGDATVDCICPIDFDWTNEHSLTGPEIAAILAKLPSEAAMVWVSDSCHAGGLDSGLARTPPPPSHLASRLAAHNRRRLRHAIGGIPNVALLAACRSTEIAQDLVVGGRTQGAFTFFFLQALANSSFPQPSLATIAERTADALHASGFAQDPELDGPSDIVHAPFLTASLRATPRATQPLLRTTNTPRGTRMSTFRVKDLMIKVLPKGGPGRLQCNVTENDTECGGSDCGITPCPDGSGCGNCSFGCSGQCTCSFGCSAGCTAECSACSDCSACTCSHCSQGCSAECSHACSDGCSAACSNACSNACSAGCSKACSGGCSNACSGGCSHQCTAGCSGACSQITCTRQPCTGVSGPGGHGGGFARMRPQDLGTLKQQLRDALAAISAHEQRTPRAPQAEEELRVLENRLEESLAEVRAKLNAKKGTKTDE